MLNVFDIGQFNQRYRIGFEQQITRVSLTQNIHYWQNMEYSEITKETLAPTTSKYFDCNATPMCSVTDENVMCNIRI